MEKLEIENEVKGKSPSIIWRFMATPEGMSHWLADEVTRQDDTLTYRWGNPWDHHEMRKATIEIFDKNKCLRFVWNEEEGEGTFVEMRMKKSALTGDYIIEVTDFATPDDMDWLKETWYHNFKRLRRSSGL